MIDGDMVIYMACAANQVTVDLNDGLGETTLVDEKESARAAVKLIEKWRTKAGCSTSIICLSSERNFRKTIYPKYKANRTAPKPEAYAYVVEAIRGEYEIYEEDGLEADDLIGIAVTSGKGQCVAVSRDKDMLTVPGLVFNPDHHNKPVRVSRSAADTMWMKQTMVGDTVDGYSGIPKIGPVGADEIILNPRRLIRNVRTIKRGKNKGKIQETWTRGGPCSLWEAMCDHAAKAGMTEEDLIVQAQLARILRAEDFNQKTRTIRLWRPNGFKEMKLDE